jgi:isoquinoline 1-oxidoreductase alpha subunit
MVFPPRELKRPQLPQRSNWQHLPKHKRTGLRLSRGVYSTLALSGFREGRVMTQKITVTLTVNGSQETVSALPDTPLLWVLREQLKLTGTKFGCGVAQCGACMVHVDGRSTYACQNRIKDLAGKRITTIEGLSKDASHPLQKAWISEQVPQCGYCQSGQIMRAADLLQKNPRPTREQIVEHMNTNICRCGTYTRIVKAIERASREA